MRKGLLLLFLFFTGLSAQNVYFGEGVSKDSEIVLLGDKMFLVDERSSVEIYNYNKNDLLRSFDSQSLNEALINNDLFLVVKRSGREVIVDGFVRAQGGGFFEEVGEELFGAAYSNLRYEIKLFLRETVADLMEEDLDDIEEEAEKLHEEILNNRLLGPVYKWLITKGGPATYKALKFVIRSSYKIIRETGKLAVKPVIETLKSLNNFYTIPEDVSIKRGLFNNLMKTFYAYLSARKITPLILLIVKRGMILSFITFL